MTRQRDIVPIERLTPLIEELLQKDDRVVRELAQITGYCEPAVRIRLEFLETDRRAHRVPRGTLGRNKGGYYVWRAGPMPSLSTLPPPPAPKGVYQRTVKEYEVHNRRDELVAALFGHAVRKQDAEPQETSPTC